MRQDRLLIGGAYIALLRFAIDGVLSGTTSAYRDRFSLAWTSHIEPVALQPLTAQLGQPYTSPRVTESSMNAWYDEQSGPSQLLWDGAQDRLTLSTSYANTDRAVRLLAATAVPELIRQTGLTEELGRLLVPIPLDTDR